MRGFLFLCLTLTTACASIDPSDYRQTVLVTSNPPGQDVYDGKRLIGTTPGYMQVRRRRDAAIRVGHENAPDQSLESSYRWADSFGMNLLLLMGAPLGWAVDLITGTAWELADPPRVGPPGRRTPRIVAVAPPRGMDSVTADALGQAIERRLRQNTTFRVRGYDETAPLFHFYRSYDGLTDDRDNRYRLFSEVGADHFLITVAERRGERFIVNGELRDVIADQVHSTYAWEIEPGTEKLKQKYTAETFINTYFKAVPNTVFLNLSNYTPTLTIDRQDHEGKEGEAENFTDGLLKYLSAISLARLEREQFNTRGHFLFAFVPTIVISQKKIVFPDYLPTVGADFHRWYVSGGYGIEGGYMGRYGLIYADLIPALTWSKVKYSSPETSGAVQHLSVQVIAEFGYSYFFTDHLIGRIFVRNLGEDRKAWNQALSEVRGQETFTEGVSSAFAGFSLGYYIPTTAEGSEGWLIRRTSR